MGLKEIDDSFSFLKSIGLKSVVITGGEPLIEKDIVSVLEILNKYRLQIVLFTNGIYLKKYLDAISNLIDWLVLPIDADNPFTNSAMRVGNINQWSLVIEALRIISDHSYNFNVRVGTVVSKLNIDHVTGIPKILNDLDVKKWKVYQTIFLKKALKNKELLYVDDIHFKKTLDNCREEAGKYNIEFHTFKKEDREHKDLFMENNGDIIVTHNGHEKKTGNIISNRTDAILNSIKYIDQDYQSSDWKKLYKQNDM